MTTFPYKSALIVGTGPGISSSLVRQLAGTGLKVAASARNTDKLKHLADETGTHLFSADATDPSAVERLFAEAEERIGVPEVVVYNASGRVRGAIVDLDPEEVRRAIEVSAFGGFLVVQQAAKRLVPLGAGAILLTGATASVKGFAQSSSFAIGKFGLRGLAQSAARELAPKGIHVAHFVIDGGVRSASRPDPVDQPDSTLDPDAIAQSYLEPRAIWRFLRSRAAPGAGRSSCGRGSRPSDMAPGRSPHVLADISACWSLWRPGRYPRIRAMRMLAATHDPGSSCPVARPPHRFPVLSDCFAYLSLAGFKDA